MVSPLPSPHLRCLPHRTYHTILVLGLCLVAPTLKVSHQKQRPRSPHASTCPYAPQCSTVLRKAPQCSAMLTPSDPAMSCNLPSVLVGSKQCLLSLEKKLKTLQIPKCFSRWQGQAVQHESPQTELQHVSLPLSLETGLASCCMHVSRFGSYYFHLVMSVSISRCSVRCALPRCFSQVSFSGTRR